MKPVKILSFAIGPIGAALLSVLALPMIAWIFPADVVGKIAMLQVAVNFSVVLFALGLDQAFVREYHEVCDAPSLLKDVLSPGLYPLLGVLIFVQVFFPFLISEALFSVQSVQIGWWVCFALLAAFSSRFLSLVLRMQERGLAFSMSQILPKALYLLCLVLVFCIDINRDISVLVIALSCSLYAVLIVVVWNTRYFLAKAVCARLSLARVKFMLKYSLPLVMAGLAFWGLTAFDKITLRMLSSFEELAIYSVSVSIAGAAMVIQAVFSTVWAPTVYKWVSEGKDLSQVGTVSRYLMVLLVLFFSISGSLSWIVGYFLPAEYRDIKYIFVACLAYPLLYTLSEATKVGIGVTRRTRFSMVIALLAFGINAVGNLLLVPVFGAAGAAASTCLSFWLFFFLRTEVSARIWQPIQRTEIYVWTSICSLLAIFMALCSDYLGYAFHMLWAVLLCVALWRFRPELKICLLWLTSQRK